MRFRELLVTIILGLIITTMTWIIYSLLVAFVAPFKTLEGAIGFLPFFIAIGVTLTLLSAFANFLFPSRKTRTDIFHLFAVNHVKLLIGIIREKDEKKEKELSEQLAEAHQEYESFINGNLLKKDRTFVTDWRESLLATRRRLLGEEDTLTLNNQANILIAIFMTFAGIVLPVYYIFFVSKEDIDVGFSVFVANYWPILSVIVVFEIIAIFFLRLYSQTEQRIERNKNEVTNIELRLTAGLMLCDQKNKTKLKPLADELAKEERNFILGKNESSTGVSSNKLIEILSKFVPKVGG